MIDANREETYARYLDYLYTTAHCKYGDCPDIDTLVQDSIVAFFIHDQKGGEITHPKALLNAILCHKYNDWLRRKYRNRIVSFEQELSPDTAQEDDDLSIATASEEYAAVRRELGRLIHIYREVTVRHYVHGQSVEEIAAALDIPRGTVLSRLSTARHQIKEGLTNMEKYASASYEPKKVSIGIWGSSSMSGEPFTLLSSPIEQNALTLAYEHPLSTRAIADQMGMPCAYLEPILDQLVEGELMGRTASGLLYTRCHLQHRKEAYGNIPPQEAMATAKAAEVWEIAARHLTPAMARPVFQRMTDKQKATLLLFILNQSLSGAVQQSRPKRDDDPKYPPERPNGGRWLASGIISDPKDTNPPSKTYASSGPVIVSFSKDNESADCRMYDCQSIFGDAHWAYADLKYRPSLQSVLRLYASFLPCDVKPDRSELYELIPAFERLHILRRDESSGEITLDIPAMTFTEAREHWDPATAAITRDLLGLLGDDLTRLWKAGRHHVPAHVDEHAYYEYENAVGAYTRAQMLAIVHQNLLPYPVTIGETPLIFVVYREKTN